MLKDMFKRKELICISCQKKIQYEEELVAFFIGVLSPQIHFE